MSSHTLMSAFGYEKGDTEHNLHAQGVARLLSTSTAMVTKRLKLYLNAYCPGVHVTCKALTNKGVHTFTGMLGYVQKDKGMKHHLLHTYNISEEHLLEGHEFYIKHGAGPLKKKKEIGPHNILAQLVTYREWHCQSGRAADMSPTSILARMFRSGKYFPSPTWANRGQGRGMSESKFSAIWRVVTHPEACSEEIVRTIMYSDDDKTYAYKSSHKAFMNTARYFHDADALQDEDDDDIQRNQDLERDDSEGNVNTAGDSEGTLNQEAVDEYPVTPGLGVQATELRAERFARLKHALQPAKLIYDDPDMPLPTPPSVTASREKALDELRADMNSDASRGRVTTHPL